MGTRADFYVGRGEKAEWLGSIAWDGHPKNYPDVENAKTEAEFRTAVEKLIASRDDGTKPENGWPWPWKDSRTTDYAYAFETDQVWICPFGYSWFKASEEEPEMGNVKTAIFPDMSGMSSVNLGKRSGVLFIKV